ncbi:MAG: hypothetical protein H7267_15420 [Sandarakinorhabdus sp.]|nr:hypothetical protein [Sandarakinorhabdus sp.]
MARTPPGSLFSFGAKAAMLAAGAKRNAASPQTAGGSRASENPADGFADGAWVVRI